MEKKDKIFFGIIFLCIALITILISIMANQGGQCVKNPFVYGASRMGDVSCNCRQDVGRDQPATFFFNDTTLDLTPQTLNGGSLAIPLDFGDLDITP